MKRRTVTLEVEIEGPKVDALDLRDAVLRLNGRNCRVVKTEVIDDGVGR